MKKKTFVLLWMIFFIPAILPAQNGYRITVSSGEYVRMDCPVFVPVTLPDTGNGSLGWHLYEKTNRGKVQVLCQQEQGSVPGLWFILDGTTRAHTQRTYILVQESVNKKDTAFMKIRRTFSSWVLEKGTQAILSYRYRVKAPPAGVDPLYQKSGYIHPLWTPAGDTLTRIQPPDHRHHYGLWGPWTKTHIQGREVDFWNLGKGQGTVRFAGLLSRSEGPVFCEVKVHQEHVDFGAKGADRVALNEILAIRAWNIGKKAWLVDYTSTQNCPLPGGILLNAYRYGGGLGFRATEKWTRNNSSVLTSEGRSRTDADGTRARWCRVEGELPHGTGGILFLDHPGNRDFPEPMRVWPPDVNKGNGDLFFDFCPIRHKSWTLKYGKNYTLKYRLYIFDSDLTPKEAEILWNAFARPPLVAIEPIKP